MSIWICLTVSSCCIKNISAQHKQKIIRHSLLMYTFADALEFTFGDALEFMPLACLYVIQFMRTGGITTVTEMIYISRDSDIVDT